VPTPLRKTKDPDLSFIVSAVEEIAKYIHGGQLVVLESTTYPGTLDEVVRPMLEASGLRGGEDFFLAFSPERVDPGNLKWTTANIPKVVGGIDVASTAAARALYEQIVTEVVAVSSPRVAEMVKLLENTFRAVNIGLVNELALMCHELHIDVWEVIEAASSKPFGFMPFYPGPGLGGHCIPIDPYYLSWKAKQEGFESQFIELAGRINASMPRFVVERVSKALGNERKRLRGARVHLFGVAYKPEVGDVRESPALDIAQLLLRAGAIVSYSDPYVPMVNQGELVLVEVAPEAAFERGFDCAIIATSHREFDYGMIASRSPLIVDTRNALKGMPGTHIHRL
jgi:UDP-N-acetyl-D-glucosamine dehydrogenase